ncbi:hypothetical protein ACHQM5_004556 [Ranunculus cassubicifolius]
MATLTTPIKTPTTHLISSSFTNTKLKNSITFTKPHQRFQSLIRSKPIQWEQDPSRDLMRLKKTEQSFKKQRGVVVSCRAGAESLFIGGGDSVEKKQEQGWFVFPERMKVVLLLAFVMSLCNADRVVMSVAIVPLAAKHGWSSSFLGIVQVLFFMLFIILCF